ncbi:hypothetical protein PANT_20d00030 [Moesziomyces antarcticus T-34]|uniref:Uncharacterized protein n=1 Tax=Pseudozyma antarctica (strain T-34) TaxID=1151754 RepID=M9MFK5_PSEA3|nr:hypothetical protein PANT_20d00030 [Moesziomyces antarcticus T-34]
MPSRLSPLPIQPPPSPSTTPQLEQGSHIPPSSSIHPRTHAPTHPRTHIPVTAAPTMSFLKKAQQHVAHTSKLPALGNQDLRQLQDIIISEKNFIQSNTKAAADFKKNAEAIKAWSAEEGPDLNDVVGKVSLLYDHYTASQNRLNSHLTTVRLHFKSIRTREEALSNLKARKRSLGSDIEKIEKKLAKMGPENKDLMRTTASLKEMRTEMEGMHVEVMNEEAAIGDFKRRTIRESLGIKSGALLEMAEKLTIIAEISKLMLDEIPLHPTQPGMPRAEYYGFAKTESLLQEATRCIADVGFNPSAPSAGIPRFGDMTLADSTPNASRSYANQDADSFNNPHAQGVGADASIDHGYTPVDNRVLAGDDVARTPIYAAHASRSHQSYGSGPGAQQYGSNRNSADYQSAQGGHVDNGAARATSTEGHHSDAYDGYSAAPNAAASEGNATAMLGAPVLPPVRTATPLNGSNANAQPVASPTTYTDDSAYFQSIGSTRAMQEAVRRPTSPPAQARMSSYGALSQPMGGSTSTEGKKVTAAAFRRGFSRNPSAQANMEEQYANPLPQPPSLNAPMVPGAYVGTTPDNEAVQPLHIQKRNSNSHQPAASALGAAAAAGSPAAMQGRRYSNDLNVSGSENPAPPYLNDAHPHQHQQAYPQQVQRQHSSQYAEYAAPPPPGYGYA